MLYYKLNVNEASRFDQDDEELIHELLERFGRVNAVNPAITVTHPNGTVVGQYGVEENKTEAATG